MKSISEILIELRCSKEMKDWAIDKTWIEFYENCPKGEWLLFLFSKTNPSQIRELTLAKGNCAKTVINFMVYTRSVKSVETATKTSTVSSYSHKGGVISSVNPSTSKINLSSTYSGTTPTNIKITAGIGKTQSATIVSMESDNTVAVLSSPIIGLASNSHYSIGAHIVDANPNLAGVFYLPGTVFPSSLAGTSTARG